MYFPLSELHGWGKRFAAQPKTICSEFPLPTDSLKQRQHRTISPVDQIGSFGKLCGAALSKEALNKSSVLQITAKNRVEAVIAGICAICKVMSVWI